MSAPDGLPRFALATQIAPIILVGGIASQLGSDGMMSILVLTEGSSDPGYSNVNDYFAQFRPVQGSTLEDWTAAEYPFASFVMAANAMIQNALKVSLLMNCPARPGSNNYFQRPAKFASMKGMLDAHVSQGGTFIVVTPAYTYMNCLLLRLVDITPTDSKQAQVLYQWDFYQPLITQAAASQSYNGIYNKLANGLPTPNPLTNSGPASTLGNAATSQPPNTSAPQDATPLSQLAGIGG